MSKKMITLLINGLALVICYALLNEGTGFIKWMNALFYVTIFNMIIFLYLFITKGQFFDGIVRSFRKVTKRADDQEQKLPSETVRLSTYQLSKFNFIILFTMMMIAQFMYFIF